MTGTLFDYFNRISVIHLPGRIDRLAALTKEFRRAGFDIDHPKVSIPPPPMPETAHGFPSRGVYGNFLSHLQIIQGAYSDGLDSVLILEDDAILSRHFKIHQPSIARCLRQNKWDVSFIGHSLAGKLPATSSGLVLFSGEFQWSHCYAMHRRLMPRVIKYFLSTIERAEGHPEGGKMYVDGAYNLFRRLNPDVTCLLSSPCLSVQKGSVSSLGASRWYDRYDVLHAPLRAIRSIRDEGWRRGLINIRPTGNTRTVIEAATPWPNARI